MADMPPASEDRGRDPDRRERDPDRRERSDRDPDRRDRDRDRDRDRGRGDRDRDRDRGRGDRDRDRGDRDRRDRSPRKERSSRRDRSRSRDRDYEKEREERRKNRKSGFDQPPPDGADGFGMPMDPALQALGSQLGIPIAAGGPAMPQQATRHARRIYVGGLPPTASEQAVAVFFHNALAAIGGNSAGPGESVVNVYINAEKKFAFVEYRTVEECSNAMALDGIVMEGTAMRVRRPNDYNPTTAAPLGSSTPAPNLNLAAIGLTGGGGGGGGQAADGPDRIFVGGLPYYLDEPQCRELMESFGPLRAFDLVRDRDNGNSKGYGFAVYMDPAVTDVACAGLNGLKMGDKSLTVRRATQQGQERPDQMSIMIQQQQQMAIMMAAPGVAQAATAGPPTKVLSLQEAVDAEELKNDEDYAEILEDMKDECGKFGTVKNVVIPRPGAEGADGAGVGKVFVEFEDEAGCAAALRTLHGRKFGGKSGKSGKTLNPKP